MAIYIKKDSVNEKISKVYRKSEGVIREILNIKRKSEGVIREVYSSKLKTLCLIHFDVISSASSAVVKDEVSNTNLGIQNLLGNPVINNNNLMFGVGAAKASAYEYGFNLQLPKEETTFEDLGESDFTFEFFAYFTGQFGDSSAGNAVLTSRVTIGGENYTYGVTINNAGSYGPKIQGNFGENINIEYGALPESGAWGHYAFVRKGSDLSLYINGELKKSISCSGEGYKFSDMGDMVSAGNYSSSSKLYYDLDELRISRVARYTSNFVLTNIAFEVD
ncbi:MAG: LamG-like jellyroll fold domain-containing protein [Eubacteriales bacterium]